MTNLKTLREFSAMITGDALQDLKYAKTEWVNTGELRFFEEKRKGFFKDKFVRILKQKWVQLHKGEILTVEWREVPDEYYQEYDYR